MVQEVGIIDNSSPIFLEQEKPHLMEMRLTMSLFALEGGLHSIPPKSDIGVNFLGKCIGGYIGCQEKQGSIYKAGTKLYYIQPFGQKPAPDPLSFR